MANHKIEMWVIFGSSLLKSMLNTNLVWKLHERGADKILWFSKRILRKLVSPPSFCRVLQSSVWHGCWYRFCQSSIVLHGFVQDMHDQCMSTFISANWSDLNLFSIEAIDWTTSILRDTHVNNLTEMFAYLFINANLCKLLAVRIFRSSWFQVALRVWIFKSTPTSPRAMGWQ